MSSDRSSDRLFYFSFGLRIICMLGILFCFALCVCVCVHACVCVSAKGKKTLLILSFRVH